MKLIVGLGNPGDQYKNTRHNIGFIFIDMMAQKYNIKFKSKFEGLIGEINIGGEKVLFLKPQTFMNLSGGSVAQAMKFYKIDSKDILVIYDDLDLDFGKIKIKIDSTAGGHNGMKDIINKLGTKKILRIKFGILNKFKKETKTFVLGKFSKEESKYIEETFDIIDNILYDFLKLSSEDYNALLNKYN